MQNKNDSGRALWSLMDVHELMETRAENLKSIYPFRAAVKDLLGNQYAWFVILTQKYHMDKSRACIVKATEVE